MQGTFEDRLAVALTLTIAGKAHAIPPGNIQSLALQMHGRAAAPSSRVDEESARSSRSSGSSRLSCTRSG